MCADGNTRAALPRLFLRVGIMAHEWICSRSGGRIHAAPCACGTPREELWRGCDRISCRWDAQKWFSDSTDFALPCPVLPWPRHLDIKLDTSSTHPRQTSTDLDTIYIGHH
jgi:hypothetical protein